MNLGRLGTGALVLVLTIISGFGDSQGFVHSARLWYNDRIVWQEVMWSSLGYGLGILMYWLAIRFLNQLAVVPAEVQTLGWFSVTIIGVAVFSGGFLKWQVVDQLVAILVLGGIGWLLFRTGG